MNSTKNRITALFFLISLAALHLILWLVDYSSLGLPEVLPGLGWRTYGILIMTSFMLNIWLYQKQLIKADPKISVFELILLSTLVIFASLLLYQFIRQNVILNRPFSLQVITSAAIPSGIFVLLAASTALSLKKVNGIIRQIPFFILIIVLILYKKYVSFFEW